MAEKTRGSAPLLRNFISGHAFYRDKDIRDGYLDAADGAFPLVRFHSLDEQGWLFACFTTRRGGVSRGYYESLNLGFKTADDPALIRANYRRTAARIGRPLSAVVMTDQVHRDRVICAKRELALGDECTGKTDAVDGLYTDTPGLALSAGFADCVPVYLADPVTRQIALVHSGWKGTAARIGARAAEALSAHGARPSDMAAVIGPSISRTHYEVTGDVIEAMTAAFSPAQMRDIAEQTDEEHYQLDLWAACFYTLTDAGLLPEHIHFSGICTYENHDLLFSHRYTNGRRGNMNAFFWIREDAGQAYP